MKLMIVEDDKALAKGIELALSEKENEITVCYDLKTAEEMWESENADLVILDVNLPDGSGYDFLAFGKRIIESSGDSFNCQRFGNRPGDRAFTRRR